MKVRLIALASILTIAAVGYLGMPGETVSAASSNASCMGLGISDHARAGEMPEVVKEIKALLAEYDLNTGEFVREFAKVHAGTHVPGCEVAAEEILTELLAG